MPADLADTAVPWRAIDIYGHDGLVRGRMASRDGADTLSGGRMLVYGSPALLRAVWIDSHSRELLLVPVSHPVWIHGLAICWLSEVV